MSKPLTNPEIKQLYSQLITQGVEGFSAIELLRALLQADDALSERLLKRYGGLHELAQTTASELAKTQDLSATQIMRLVSALEIGKGNSRRFRRHTMQPVWYRIWRICGRNRRA
jgi:DNA repair protein RadC